LRWKKKGGEKGGGDWDGGLSVVSLSVREKTECLPHVGGKRKKKWEWLFPPGSSIRQGKKKLSRGEKKKKKEEEKKKMYRQPSVSGGERD